MATKTWTGNVSGQLTNPNNWSPTGVPAAGDDIVFTQGAVNAPDPTLGQLTNAMASVRVDSTYPLGIGGPAANAHMDIVGNGSTNVTIDASHADAGGIYLDVVTGAVANVYVRGATTGVWLTGSAAIANLYVLSGKVTVGAAAACTISTAIWVGYISSETEASLVLEQNATVSSSALAYQFSGGVTSRIAFGGATNRLVLAGGSWTQIAGNLTLVEIVGGALTWYGGTITTARVIRGVLDGSVSPASRQVGTLVVARGGTANLANGVGSITWTSLLSLGGQIILDDGRTL